ncbi:MAG: hypothetical protein ABIO38_08875 [Luteimonas sp.]
MATIDLVHHAHPAREVHVPVEVGVQAVAIAVHRVGIGNPTNRGFVARMQRSEKLGASGPADAKGEYRVAERNRGFGE